MKHMPKLRSRYSYQEYKRVTYSNTIREDLRIKLKKYSINTIHQPESKLLDCMLDYFLNDKEHMEILNNLVKNYY